MKANQLIKKEFKNVFTEDFRRDDEQRDFGFSMSKALNDDFLDLEL